MALTLGDNFSYQGQKPLDGRIKYDTVAAMKSVADATMYDGCEAYCAETDKYYKFKSTNTVDADTGKWREREDSAGHIIEDSEGTELTQRDTLQFGEGFLAEDDSENEKTVISPNVMPSEDMSEVISPLPSIQSRYHKYSTEEQIVGEWIDGKTLYQKTFVDTLPAQPASASYAALFIDVGASVEYGYISSLVVKDATAYIAAMYTTNDTSKFVKGYLCSNAHYSTPNKIAINCNNWYEKPVYVTIQYTKTT